MKRSIARKWAAALDSGEYGQTTGTLRKNGKFCCLGVLCNMHAQAHPEIAKTQRRAKEYLGCEALPPHEVTEWSGMASDDGRLSSSVEINGKFYNDLADLNDNAKLTFPEIAKVIRKHWEEL